MKSFRKSLATWWHKTSRTSRHSTSRPSLARLALEHLEDRRVLSLTYGGGALLQNVQVENIFYGSAWYNNPTLYQSAGQLDGVMNDITRSSYIDMLGEYAIGRGQLQDGIINLSDPYRGNIVDDSEIQNMLDAGINQGALQPPSPNQLYTVYTAPNVVVTRGGGDSQHNFLGYHDSFWDPNLGPIYYEVIPHPIGNQIIPGLNYFQTQTTVTSHELSEAVTDADYYGWNGGNASQEIGDICEGVPYLGQYHGYVVQSEWSNYYNSCIIPYDASWFLPNSPGPEDHAGQNNPRVIGGPAPHDAAGLARLGDPAGLGVDLSQPLSPHVLPTTGSLTTQKARADDFFAGLVDQSSDSAQSLGHRRSDAEILTSDHDLGSYLKLQQDETLTSLDASFQRMDDLMV